MPLYFINPKRATKNPLRFGVEYSRSKATTNPKRARPVKKRKRSKLRGAARAAFLRRMAAGRRKARRPATSRRRTPTRTPAPTRTRKRPSSRSVISMATKRRKTARRRSTRRRSHRRSFGFVARRNPPRSGIVGTAVQGVKDAGLILAGKAATNFAARLVPTTSATLGVATRVAAAIGVGLVARRALGADAARMVIAGGLISPIENAVKAANVPLLSGALASDEEIGSYYEGVGAYLESGRAPGSASVNGVGDSGNMYDPMGMAAVA